MGDGVAHDGFDIASLDAGLQLYAGSYRDVASPGAFDDFGNSEITQGIGGDLEVCGSVLCHCDIWIRCHSSR